MSKALLVEQQDTTEAKILHAETRLIKDQNTSFEKDIEYLRAIKQVLEDELALEKAKSEHLRNLFLNSRQKYYGKRRYFYKLFMTTVMLNPRTCCKFRGHIHIVYSLNSIIFIKINM